MSGADRRFDRRARAHFAPAVTVEILPVAGLLTGNRDIERSSWWASAPQSSPATTPETP
ncbi:hypothetical protein LJR143_002216 [Pseudoxanthomonas sp. LjRoot143]|uniref:hypothetical protein n=1 Tax=Pseudoxanthomonas sp. LjRoot143 TaxID=3342266 RepID=UPI003ECF4516